jgi:hypothetical protein
MAEVGLVRLPRESVQLDGKNAFTSRGLESEAKAADAREGIDEPELPVRGCEPRWKPIVHHGGCYWPMMTASTSRREDD